MQIKICGIRTLEAAQAAIDAGATHIGFIFFPRSPRNISPSAAGNIAKQLNGKVLTVAVTVNATDEFLAEIITELDPDYLQLHGTESPARCTEISRKFNKPLIKAISVSEASELKNADDYKKSVRYIMFDAKPPAGSDLPGGNAVSFSWKILNNFIPDYQWILSGGLNPENINQAIDLTKTDFVDVSSGVESSPGVKDLRLIEDFIAKIG